MDNQGKAIEILNFEQLKQIEKRIDFLKSRRDRCQRKSKLVEFEREDGSIHRHYEPSRRWKFFNDKLEKECQKRREQTKVYLFTLANRLCKEYDIIGVGDYTPRGGGISKGMRRSMNNHSLIGRFKSVLGWVCYKSNKIMLVYPEGGTTKTCYSCKYKAKESLSPDIREWTCPECHAFHIRDENAAQNGLLCTYQELETTHQDLKLPGSGHLSSTIEERWVWQVKASGVITTPRGL